MNTESQTARSMFARCDPLNHRWGVILAGGDGKRLLPLTRRITGDNRPKQFCAIMNGETLLAQTRRRVARMVEPRRTLLVVTKTHECFYADQLVGVPPGSLLVQPCNQGTAPAILYSLFRLRGCDPSAVVGFFPSDHHFADDKALIAHVASAFEAAESPSGSGKVVLLGIAPNDPEVEYGWIEPGLTLTKHAVGTVFEVSRFWEKPDPSTAASLMKQGCLWNSFLMVGRVDAYLNLIRRTLPVLFESFDSIRESLLTATEPAALLHLYSRIPDCNFSADVLAARPTDLAVLSSGNLGWTDLGEASRILSVLERNSGNAEWALVGNEECIVPG